ncbi:sigma-54 interaction domain-containing protein [Pseudomonas costantinii]|uniref:DNA-binding protein Fis n=1 Tax=Pseudomonas costantinii TaxID=168469 RepID=A0A1S2V4G0_9PSED|nr:sigma 54-interacting transcriptional regulator [Pseudomonas costantinii]NVZ22034.1 sigma 54-interacting transcriptional regulator [Pseudomonas costantinii]OIN53340.1 sigma-54-dependent Fis family transcriptional regulator [Pseudomonas costantinii]SEE51581.1 DNA-binding protein Fis [Pseudomonas costantinii]
MMQNLFNHLSDPLAYADTLLNCFTRLGLDSDETTLPDLCVAGAAQLSQCELTQLYLLDKVTGRLDLIAQHLPEALSLTHLASGSALQNEQLLHYVLNQRCSLSLDEVGSTLYDTGFLPVMRAPWRSLLGVPLFDRSNAITGVLLCASWQPRQLQDYATSLGQLGSFALNQLLMLRCMQPRADATRSQRGVPITGAYGLIGSSEAMEQTCHLIGKVLHTPYTVLLRGETGTGKEVVARAIHAAGPRSAQAFVVQNCAAFPEGLLESELFGYRKGAFTGAERNYAGLFDAAHGGTLLLDEIGDMPLSLQAKLLRVLQEGEVRPLGATAAHKVDVRIIAATHRDLAAMVAEGSFREDLYYRLAQFPIQLPALRERDGDVLQLARHFADKACASLGRAPVDWSSIALDQLSSHGFPGNVRELKCLVERAVLLCDDGVILPAHLSLPLTSAAASVADATLRQRMERVERVFLIDCLHKNRGNRTRTARELGVARRTLLYRLARLNIPFGNASGEC